MESRMVLPFFWHSAMSLLYNCQWVMAVLQISKHSPNLRAILQLSAWKHITIFAADSEVDFWNGNQKLPLGLEWSSGRAITLVERILEMVHINQSNITGVVMVGDSPHLPNLQSTLESFFPGKKIPKDEEKGFRHDQVIVYGAAWKPISFPMSTTRHFRCF